MSDDPDPTIPPGPLADVRVIDLSAVLAGPGIARHLADFGADVIKVERAGVGDTARNLGWRDDDGETHFFKLANRNKRFVELDLTRPDGRDRLLELVGEAHVLVENMRPGKLEALGLGPADLHAVNPGLVVVRVTAFGQSGPYRDRPGFATLAEAMSGFAALNGSDPDGPPTLPPVALTDEVTALAGAFATMVALHSGVGQVVDVNLIESLLQIMGPLPALWLKGGQQQPRLGSGLPYSVPRGSYRTSDDRWIAVSTSADTVAARVLTMIGLGDDERLATTGGRMAHRDEVEAAMAAWVAERTLDEALAGFEQADAAAAPVYDMAALTDDAHARDRGLFVEADGYPMQGPAARLSATPARITSPGRALGADNESILPGTGWPE